MDVAVRAAISDGKNVKYKFFHSPVVLLTEMQSGHLDPAPTAKGDREPRVDFVLMFEHGAWIESFDPDVFSQKLSEMCKAAPRRNYSKPRLELAAEIKEWRKRSTEQMKELSFGLFS